jgi:hypothetical protein
LTPRPTVRYGSAVFPGSIDTGAVVLWEADDLRCLFRRRASAPAFEVTIQRGPEVLQCIAFEYDADASAFAIAAMRAATQK